MIRKAYLLVTCSVLMGLMVPGRTHAQEGKKGFVDSKNQGWMVNMEEAYQRSEKTNRPILANFTGSDWCGWCKKLNREVFSQPEFIKWAKDNVVLLELDYPRRGILPKTQKRQNAELQEAFGVTGFPTIWMFDLNRPDGERFQIQAYGKTGYAPGGPSAYIRSLNKMIETKEKGTN